MLFRSQMARGNAPRVQHLSGGIGQSMSLRQLSAWCAGRFGAREVASDPQPRPFDVPWLVLDAAAAHGVLGKTLALWLWPIFFFSLFNSMRFIAEHYGTPWDAGQMAGTRTVTSNPVHSFFWNNINWHIGHHVYPNVPWYNLVELHRLLEKQIAVSGALIDKSYVAVLLNAIRGGPETEERLARSLGSRRGLAD